MIIELSDSLRAEDGPRRKRGKATPRRMDYLKSHYRVGGVDSMGKPIRWHKEFDYIDWPGDRIWNLYEHRGGRWRPCGAFETLDKLKSSLEYVDGIPYRQRPG